MLKGVMLVGEPMGLFIAQSEGSLETASAYSCAVAGAEFNVAVGLSRLEHKVGYLTKLGRDPLGKRIINVMEQNKIDTDLITWSDEQTTGFMLKSRVSTGDPDIFYFRKNSAACTLDKADIDRVDFSGYSCLHMTGIFPALSAYTREAAFHLIDKARENGLTISFDPNLRLQLWSSKEEMITTINSLAAKSDIVFPGIAEGKILTGSDDPATIADFYLKSGVKAVVIKLGAKGAYVAEGSERCIVDGVKVEKVVDTVGAGDGFAAGTLSALLEELPLVEAVERGNAIGAIQVMSRGDNDGLPDRDTLAKFMGKTSL